MNCERVRQTLLGAERPEPPPVEVRPHLTGCVECREWLRRLGTMERQLALVPVPASQGKERLLRRLRTLDLDRASSPSQSVPLPARLKERGLRKLAVASALAATVAAFAVGLWLWPHRESPAVVRGAPDPIAEWDAQRSKRLADARTPSAQVKGLSDFAGTLQEEAADLARRSDGDRLEKLAKYYDGLICQQLIEAARTVPGAEREAVLQEARRALIRTDSKMQRLAVELPSSAQPLQQIASAAREGDKRLRALLRGEGA